jgi:Domain of unknown function (DUF4328)
MNDGPDHSDWWNASPPPTESNGVASPPPPPDATPAAPTPLPSVARSRTGPPVLPQPVLPHPVQPRSTGSSAASTAPGLGQTPSPASVSGQATPTYLEGRGPRPPAPPTRVRTSHAPRTTQMRTTPQADRSTPSPSSVASTSGAPMYPRPYAVSRGLSGTLQAFLWVTAVCAAVAAVLALVTRAAFVSYWEAPLDSLEESDAYDAWTGTDTALSAFQGLMYIAWIVVFILLIVWTYHAHRASEQLWRGPRKWSSGWTVGAWFVPVANLILPVLVLSEIESIAKGHGDAASAGGRRLAAPSGLGWVWWLCTTGGMITAVIGVSIMPVETDLFFVSYINDPDGVRASYVVQAIGLGAIALGTVLGAAYVRSISRPLSPDALGRP